MNALGIWLHCTRGPRDLAALEATIDELGRMANVVPARIVTRAARPRSRTYKPQRLHEDMSSPGTLQVTLASLSDGRIDGLLQDYYLRPFEPTDADHFICTVNIVSTALPLELTPALMNVLGALANNYVVGQGFVTGFSNPARAGRELFSGAYSPQDVDLATADRIHEDAMSKRQLATKLRRLYPLTIIGKRIWETMPAIPEGVPGVRVSELGDCKLLEAWPALVEPRDPAFLAGTRALRAWLWPYTIQNPADAPGLDEES